MKVNENVVATTKDWLKTEKGIRITAYDPSCMTRVESEVVEPGKAVNLPAADRARMNRAKPGVHTKPERV
jgi:hypothetical protein